MALEDQIANLAIPDINASFLTGLQQGEALRIQRAQQQQAQAMQAVRMQALQRALTDPSAQNYAALMAVDPEHHQAFKAAWDSQDAATRNANLQDVSAVRGYLYAGQPDKAKAVVQRQLDAYEKSGQPIEGSQQLLDLIDNDPTAAAKFMDYMLAGALGPDKWAEGFGKVAEVDANRQKLPGEIEQAAATTAKTKAETAEIPANAQAERQVKQAQAQDLYDQISNRALRLDLDKDTLAYNVDLRQQELAQKGTQVSGLSEKTMTDAVLNAASSRALAGRASDLADKFQQANLSGGWMAAMAQGIGGITGNPNQLRTQYQGLVGAQAVKNLPPGPASDKDIQLALKGFPPPTANKETVVSFLRGVAKLQNYVANTEDAKADWISANGNIGTAKRDLTVNGVLVPAGTTFGEFQKSQAAYDRRQAGPDRSYMRFGGQ